MLDERIINSKYHSERNLVKDSFIVLCNLFFGSKDSKEKLEFVDFFNKNVTISIYNQTDKGKHLYDNSVGVTYRDEDTGKINVEFRGYEGAKVSEISNIKVTAVHELCHAFTCLFCMKNSHDVTKNGIKFQNYLGLVKQNNAMTEKPIKWGYYGKFYNETMMNIISALATRTLIGGGDLTIDDVFSLNYRDWNCDTDAYSPLTSVTRLTIAAFSNVAPYKYQDIVNLGGSIFKGRARKQRQENSYLFNDFLYGIVCDPLHIDMVYDTYMGDGAFRNLSNFLDNIFVREINGKAPKGREIKSVMDRLQTFANRRVRYYYRNGILNEEEFTCLASRFNTIFNDMQEEYNAYFSKREIRDIYDRAHKM